MYNIMRINKISWLANMALKCLLNYMLCASQVCIRIERIIMVTLLGLNTTLMVDLLRSFNVVGSTLYMGGIKTH